MKITASDFERKIQLLQTLQCNASHHKNDQNDFDMRYTRSKDLGKLDVEQIICLRQLFQAVFIAHCAVHCSFHAESNELRHNE